MPPKTRRDRQDGMPSTQAELEQIIANRVAAAIAHHEANRSEHSGGSGGSDRRDRSSTGIES